ncbi:MAG: glycoside hydrolase family 75 protein [Deltaproteobacteria bacterium]|nr:glycoside hydrolase family 75 protein [Deltaproteobacteria bacterium]MCW5801137.1 glycoside hydrolase family 75 protein [Deltaproteobacteria bacterium]
MRATALVLLIACGDAGAGGDPDAPPGDAPPGTPTAEQLLARIATCDLVVGGPFARDAGGTADVAICGFPGAVAWIADLDIDCDGKMSPQCNLMTDPAYMGQTAATDSHGDPLDAATLPFVVIPGRSARFDYLAAGLGMRSVVAVVYQGQVEYGVLGDVGPAAIIGEASYAMAERLGIDPDPATGGADGGVAYIAFTGAEAKVAVIEDHGAAVALGIDRAKQLLEAP